MTWWLFQSCNTPENFARWNPHLTALCSREAKRAVTVDFSSYKEETGKSVGEGSGDLAAGHYCLK